MRSTRVVAEYRRIYLSADRRRNEFDVLNKIFGYPTDWSHNLDDAEQSLFICVTFQILSKKVLRKDSSVFIIHTLHLFRQSNWIKKNETGRNERKYSGGKNIKQFATRTSREETYVFCNASV